MQSHCPLGDSTLWEKLNPVNVDTEILNYH
jgi:hypothetical protein